MTHYTMRRAVEAVGISRAQFYTIRDAFPPARRDPTGKPYFLACDIDACREVLRTGLGHDGKRRRFSNTARRRKIQLST